MYFSKVFSMYNRKKNNYLRICPPPLSNDYKGAASGMTVGTDYRLQRSQRAI